MLNDIIQHLRALVAFDTRNPPRAIGTGGIFDYLRDALTGFVHVVTDHGGGAVSLLSTRGNPERVFNFHLDTVPSSDRWTRDPLQLLVRDERAIGLGACDIKGAAAAMLVAASRSRDDLALLFSSDEEANDARCIAGFLASDHRFREAIVAEPTMAQARLMHRGIVSARIEFAGVPGHASEARAMTDNAIHRAVAWSAQALDFVRSQQSIEFAELNGLPFNLGRIEGGIKSNVIAPSCELRFGFRPLPSQSVDELLAFFAGAIAPSELQGFEELFRGPPLPAGTGSVALAQLEAARGLAAKLGLPTGPAVNFWTEAALFSEAGLTALVYGPGDIAQAHTADEWVALSQLQTVAQNYLRIIGAGHGR